MAVLQPSPPAWPALTAAGMVLPRMPVLVHGPVEVQYLGPLAQAQTRLTEIRAMQTGLQLTAAERQTLRAARGGGRRLSERGWRRIRILELLDRGWKQSQTATAVGTYPREVRRVG